MRQREDDMKVAHAEKFLRSVGQPPVAGIGLAFWAMAIAAGAIRDGAIAALRTLIQVPAQRVRAARRDGTVHLQVLKRKPTWFPVEESPALPPDNIAHPPTRPLHFIL